MHMHGGIYPFPALRPNTYQWFTCQNKTSIVSHFWSFFEIKSNDSLIRYIVKEPEDQTWGAIDENGEWSGMIGQIIRKVKYS